MYSCQKHGWVYSQQFPGCLGCIEEAPVVDLIAPDGEKMVPFITEVNEDALGVRDKLVSLGVGDTWDSPPYIQTDVNGRILVKCPTCMKEGALEWNQD